MRLFSVILALAMVPLAVLSQDVESITVLFRYKQSVARDIRAFLVADSLYVDTQQLAEFVMGSCTIDDDDVTIDLGGEDIRATFAISECVVRDSSTAVSIHALTRLPGIRATFSYNDLSIWLISERPLAIDLVDESWLRHLHRTNNIAADQKPNMIIQADRPFIGGGSLLYDVGTVTTQLGTTVSVNASTGFLLAGGDLNMNVSALVTPSNEPLINVRGGWRIGQPNGQWWTSLGIGVLRNERQLAPLLYGAVLTNSPLGVGRSFGTDSAEIRVAPLANVDVLVNGSFRSSHIADEAGRVVLPITVNYGITSVELEIFESSGQVIRKPLRFRVDNSSVPLRQLQYTASVGYSTEIKTTEGHAVMGYGLTSNVTIGATLDAAAALYDWSWWHAGVSTTVRIGTASILSAYYTPTIAAGIAAILSVTPSCQVQAEYTSYMRDAWSNGSRIGIRPATSTTIDAARIELTAFGILGLPLTYTSVYTARRQADLPIAQRLRWNLSYSHPLANISIGSTHDQQSGPIHSYTESALWLRFPSNVWAREILNGMRVGLEGGTAWSSLQPWWRYTIEKKIRLGMLQQTIGITSSATTPTTFFVRAELRLPSVQAQVSGDMDGSQTTVRSSITGGVRLDDDSWDVEFARQMRASTAAVVLVCFEDANGSGLYEDGERLIPDVGITNTIGQRQRHPTGGLLITDLIANAEYTFNLDRSTMNDPYVKLSSDVISVTTEPYHTTAVYIPLRTVSVVEGSIVSTKPRQGVTVTLTDARGRSETSTTFSDGTFTFAGIDPGTYSVVAEGADPVTIDVSEVASTITVVLKQRE